MVCMDQSYLTQKSYIISTVNAHRFFYLPLRKLLFDLEIVIRVYITHYESRSVMLKLELTDAGWKLAACSPLLPLLKPASVSAGNKLINTLFNIFCPICSSKMVVRISPLS